MIPDRVMDTPLICVMKYLATNWKKQLHGKAIQTWLFRIKQYHGALHDMLDIWVNDALSVSVCCIHGSR